MEVQHEPHTLAGVPLQAWVSTIQRGDQDACVVVPASPPTTLRHCQSPRLLTTSCVAPHQHNNNNRINGVLHRSSSFHVMQSATTHVPHMTLTPPPQRSATAPLQRPWYAYTDATHEDAPKHEEEPTWPTTTSPNTSSVRSKLLNHLRAMVADGRRWSLDLLEHGVCNSSTTAIPPTQASRTSSPAPTTTTSSLLLPTPPQKSSTHHQHPFLLEAAALKEQLAALRRTPRVLRVPEPTFEDTHTPTLSATTTTTTTMNNLSFTAQPTSPTVELTLTEESSISLIIGFRPPAFDGRRRRRSNVIVFHLHRDELPTDDDDDDDDDDGRINTQPWAPEVHLHALHGVACGDDAGSAAQCASILCASTYTSAPERMYVPEPNTFGPSRRHRHRRRRRSIADDACFLTEEEICTMADDDDDDDDDGHDNMMGG